MGVNIAVNKLLSSTDNLKSPLSACVYTVAFPVGGDFFQNLLLKTKLKLH